MATVRVAVGAEGVGDGAAGDGEGIAGRAVSVLGESAAAEGMAVAVRATSVSGEAAEAGLLGCVQAVEIKPATANRLRTRRDSGAALTRWQFRVQLCGIGEAGAVASVDGAGAR